MILNRNDALFLLIDMQEKFAPAISRFDKVAGRCGVLLKSLNLMNVPVVVTEQYPKGLGPTIEPLNAELGNAKKFEKGCFSCLDSEEIAAYIRSTGKKTLILAGIESHICVYQTAVGAVKDGFKVYVASDAVSSRYESDKESALTDMRMNGIHVLPVESLVFMALGTSKDPAFKRIQALVRDSSSR